MMRRGQCTPATMLGVLLVMALLVCPSHSLDIPGMKAINAVAEAGSSGLNKALLPLSAAASKVTSVAMVPVNIVSNALAQVGAAIASVTPGPIRALAEFVWSFLPDMDSPMVVIVMAVQFASDIQWYKRMASLMWKMMTGSGREAACDFCDQVITTVMDLKDTKDEASDPEELCGAVCPFGIKYCMNICTNLMDAIGSSTKFPCEAIGMCPSLDEDGEEIECSYQVSRGCQPSQMCTLKRMLPMPQCDLKPGYKQWKKKKANLLKNMGQLAEAIHKLPNCGEEGASELFCVNEPKGFSLFCEYVGMVFVLVFATFNSIRAIETKGGDDDRQWLTFWIIYFIFSVVERLSSVLLSQIPIYYELKLCAIVWLFPPFFGARWLYVVVHDLFKTVRSLSLVRVPLRAVITKMFGELTEEEMGMWLGEHFSRSSVAFMQDVNEQFSDKKAYKNLETKVFDKLNNNLEQVLQLSKLCGKSLPVKPKEDNVGRMYSRAAGRGKITMPEDLAQWTEAQVQAAVATIKLEEINLEDTALKQHPNYEKYQMLNAVAHIALELVHKDLISDITTLMQTEITRQVKLEPPPSVWTIEEKVEERLKTNPQWVMYTRLQREWRELEVRYLEVTIVRGENFRKMDAISLLGSYVDPYLTLDLRNNYPLELSTLSQVAKMKDEAKPFAGVKGGKSYRFYPYRTPVAWKQRDPRWNYTTELVFNTGFIDEEGEWQNPAAPFHTLVMALYDADFPNFLGNKQSITKCPIEIPLCHLLDGRHHAHIFEFDYEDDKKAIQTAELHFLLRFAC